MYINVVMIMLYKIYLLNPKAIMLLDAIYELIAKNSGASKKIRNGIKFISSERKNLTIKGKNKLKAIIITTMSINEPKAVFLNNLMFLSLAILGKRTLLSIVTGFTSIEVNLAPKS